MFSGNNKAMKLRRNNNNTTTEETKSKKKKKNTDVKKRKTTNKKPLTTTRTIEMGNLNTTSNNNNNNNNNKKNDDSTTSGKDYLLVFILIIVNIVLYNYRYQLIPKFKSSYDMKPTDDGQFLIEMEDLIKQEAILTSSSSSSSTTTTSTTTTEEQSSTSTSTSTASTTTTEQEKQQTATTTTNTTIDTTIIISTSLGGGRKGAIVPNVQQIIDLLDSIERNVDGISIKTIPIIIAIDGQDSSNSHKDIYDFTMNTLNTKYINNKETYPNNNIQILPGNNHYHLAGNLKRAIDIVTTKYIYVLYQEIPFTYKINHNQLIESMKEFNPYNKLRCIKFRDSITNNYDLHQCKEGEYHNDPIFQSKTNNNDLKFFQSNQFFDTNQLTTKLYYDEILGALGGVLTRRSIAEPMARVSPRNCTFWGQSIYPAH